MDAFDKLELNRDEFINEILEQKPNYNRSILDKLYIVVLMQVHYEIVFNKQDKINNNDLEIELNKII
jgi:GTP-binding protein EngB required for normal cell division